MFQRMNHTALKRLRGNCADACSNLDAAEGQSAPPAKV